MLAVGRAAAPPRHCAAPRRAAAAAGARLRSPSQPHVPRRPVRGRLTCAAGPTGGELDLTEENVAVVLLDAREELSQMFDEQLGMTGTCTLADLDGPFVTLRLMGRFWHPRGMVLARVAAYLQTRIPEIAEVRIENEKQLDDSAENF